MRTITVVIMCSWEDDENLRDALEQYNDSGLKQEQILDFVSNEFPTYLWSLRSLQRRLRYFNIKHNEITNDTILQAMDILENELKGPGQWHKMKHKFVIFLLSPLLTDNFWLVSSILTNLLFFLRSKQSLGKQQ